VSTLRKLILTLCLTAALTIIGIVGFIRFESISLSESVYQTIMIMLAHFDHYGFKSENSRLLVVFLTVTSLLVIAYLLKLLAESMMGIGDSVKRRRMQAKIDHMKNHYILCGYGRVGVQVAKELINEGVKFVVVDADLKRLEKANAEGIVTFLGDCTHHDTLKKLGLDRASGLIATLGDDPDNLLVTLAARDFNQDLYIVSRANREENIGRLKTAGANRVAMPYQIGGYHMANMAIRPNVVDYMDIISDNGKNNLEVEEMVVAEHSKLSGHRLGQSLADANIKGATVIAINGADGTSKVSPSGKEVVYPGDRLIILGAKSDLNEASALIR